MTHRRRIPDRHNVRTGDGVVHAPGYLTDRGQTLLRCAGRCSASTVTDVQQDLVTCLWCISGMEDTTLRWFKWANEP